MKKIYYSFISVFVLALSSCSGMLEPEPYGLVELDLVWTKYNYTASYADRLGANNEWTGGFDYSAYTDEAQDVTDRIGGNYYNWNTSDFSASNFPLKGNYFNAYNNIRTSAYYLNNEYKISYDGLDPNERNFWIAKAHVTRAWHYFDLMRRYGKAVLFDEVFAPDEDFTDVYISGPEAIADFIMEDLDAALEIPEAENSPYAFRWQLTDDDQGVLNRGFAWVLKSRTALFAASPLFYEEGSKYDWEKAYQINKEALEQLLKHEHALFDITPAATVAQNSYAYYHIYPAGDYSRSVDKETILANWVSYDMWLTNGLPVNKGMTSCGICPSQELVDCYETIDGEPVLDLAQPYLDEQHLMPNYNKKNRLYDPNNPYANRDPRFEATIYYNGCPRYLVKPDSVTVWTYDGGNCSISDKAQGRFNTRTGYYLRKFNASDADEDHQTDGRAHVARLAEIYLNLAECACESGRLDEAREACNAVRHRAGMPDLPANLNQDELRLRIRNERRVEFAFENMRFWDVRRWKIADQTDVQLTGMHITKDASGKFTYQRFAFDPRENKSDSKYLLFPLSEDEVTKMKHNCGEDWQNPGW